MRDKFLKPYLKNQYIVASRVLPINWGLRDYGLEPLVWGGDRDCEHQWGDEKILEKCGKPTQAKGIFEGRNLEGIQSQKTIHQGQFCQLCGAWRGSLGLEPTPELYVQHLVEIFRLVRRVLRDDGTVWLNLGDSYAGSMKGMAGDKAYGGEKQRTNKGSIGLPVFDYGNLKPKDLIGIPWRVAFVLQSDGWYLRSDIIWAKENPMPESVKDRPTKAHEYIFLFSKNQQYYYDMEAIKEPCSLGSHGSPNINPGWKQEAVGNNQGGYLGKWTDIEKLSGRNKRSVWTIPTQPFPEAHFAVFPERLIEPCVLAGCPQDGIVLDPFIGSGTTAIVSLKHNCHCIGIDLSSDYVKMAEKRIAKECPQLNLRF